MDSPPKKRMKTEAEAGTEAEPKQLLPDDLVLEIVARCPTIADVIRCAAASKHVRRGILHASFLRRLRGFPIRNGEEHGHGSPPVQKLLLGLYHQSGDPHRQLAFVPASGAAKLPPTVAALPPAPDRDDDACGGECGFGPYLPVASRRSLLVLRRRCKNHARDHLAGRHGLQPVELSVCNPTTGERRVLPPHDVLDMSHALFDVDPIAPSSAFKLLVAELSDNDPFTLYVQIFSSEEGEWGPPLACPITSRLGDSGCDFACAGRPRPVVLGDTVHWLCTTDFGDRILTWRRRGGGAHQASILKLPRGHRIGLPKKCLAVLPRAGDGDAAGSSEALLSLIVLERGEIKVWARERGGGAGSTWVWKVWHRVQEASIPRPKNLGKGWLSAAELSWFCEGSGTLFLRAGDEAMSPLLLDLESMEVSKLEARKWELNPEPEFCPYEVDLLSFMLFMMKQF